MHPNLSDHGKYWTIIQKSMRKELVQLLKWHDVSTYRGLLKKPLRKSIEN